MLSAVYHTGGDVLVRVKFVDDAGTGAVTMQLAIRYARVHNDSSYPLFFSSTSSQAITLINSVFG
jgi:hypothetical protein